MRKSKTKGRVSSGHSSPDECRTPDCPHCNDRRSFELPEPLLDAFANGKIVLFAGAGISTEGNRVFKTTLRQDVTAELDLPDADKLTFPQIMDVACERLGRAWLLRQIRKRIDYLRSFPEVYRNATTFHREMATVPFLEEIFTTNWDDLFEQECGALPVATPDDFVLWDMPGRKVFKIHGSVGSLGSLVLTTHDYDRSYQQLESGLIGSRLKLALATKTVLFCGYSLSDPDFARLYQIVCREMGTAKPAIYLVTLDAPRVAEFGSMGLTPILTDASYFFEEVKKRLVAEKIMIPEQNLTGVYRLLQRVKEEHRKLHRSFQIHIHPETVFAASYQDGLTHACEHLLSMATSGKYSHTCQIHGSVRAYEETRAEKLKSRRYDDVAYIDGYTNGLAYLIAPPAMRKKLPLYYAFGAGEVRTLKEYAKSVCHAKDLHKQAYSHARRLVRGLTNGGRLIEFHHIAFL